MFFSWSAATDDCEPLWYSRSFRCWAQSPSASSDTVRWMRDAVVAAAMATIPKSFIRSSALNEVNEVNKWALRQLRCWGTPLFYGVRQILVQDRLADTDERSPQENVPQHVGWWYRSTCRCGRHLLTTSSFAGQSRCTEGHAWVRSVRLPCSARDLTWVGRPRATVTCQRIHPVNELLVMGGEWFHIDCRLEM